MHLKVKGLMMGYLPYSNFFNHTSFTNFEKIFQERKKNTDSFFFCNVKILVVDLARRNSSKTFKSKVYPTESLQYIFHFDILQTLCIDIMILNQL